MTKLELDILKITNRVLLLLKDTDDRFSGSCTTGFYLRTILSFLDLLHQKISTPSKLKKQKETLQNLIHYVE